MKHLSRILFVIIMLLCMTFFALAQGNVSGILAGDQDYVLLGTVVDITDTSIILDPYHCIHNGNGTMSISLDENIEISKFRYSYCAEHTDISTSPRVGDNVFLSLNRTSGGYVMANGAYKTSSVSYKLLTFYVPESVKGKSCLAEIVALSHFVRNNGYSREYEIKDGKAYVTTDGKLLDLSPTDTVNKLVTFVSLDGKVPDTRTKDVIIDGGYESEDDDFRWVVAGCIIVLSAIVGAFVIYNMNGKEIKSFRGNKE